MRGHPDDDALTREHEAANDISSAAHGVTPVGEHLAQCQRCRTSLTELVTLRTRLAALRGADVPSELLDRLTHVEHPDASPSPPAPAGQLLAGSARRRRWSTRARQHTGPARSTGPTRLTRPTRPRRDVATTVLAHLSLLPPALTGGLAIAVLLGGAVVARQVVHAHENAASPSVNAQSLATVSVVSTSPEQSNPAVFSTPALTATDRDYRHTTLAAGVTSLVPQVLSHTNDQPLAVLNAVPDAPAQDCLTALARRNGVDGVLAVDVASYDDVPVFLVVVRGTPLADGAEVALTGQTAPPSSVGTAGTATSRATVSATQAALAGSAADAQPTADPSTPYSAQPSTSPSAKASSAAPFATASAVPNASPASSATIAVTGFVVARSCSGTNVHLLDQVVVNG